MMEKYMLKKRGMIEPAKDLGGGGGDPIFGAIGTLAGGALGGATGIPYLAEMGAVAGGSLGGTGMIDPTQLATTAISGNLGNDALDASLGQMDSEQRKRWEAAKGIFRNTGGMIDDDPFAPGYFQTGALVGFNPNPTPGYIRGPGEAYSWERPEEMAFVEPVDTEIPLAPVIDEDNSDPVYDPKAEGYLADKQLGSDIGIDLLGKASDSFLGKTPLMGTGIKLMEDIALYDKLDAIDAQFDVLDGDTYTDKYGNVVAKDSRIGNSILGGYNAAHGEDNSDNSTPTTVTTTVGQGDSSEGNHGPGTVWNNPAATEIAQANQAAADEAMYARRGSKVGCGPLAYRNNGGMTPPDTVVDGKFFSSHAPKFQERVGPLAKVVHKDKDGYTWERHYHDPDKPKPVNNGGKKDGK